MNRGSDHGEFLVDSIGERFNEAPIHESGKSRCNRACRRSNFRLQ